MEDVRSSAGLQNASVALGGFNPGRYRLFVYGWGGHIVTDNVGNFLLFDSQSGADTRIDLHFNTTWPGRQVLGETYFTYDFSVKDASDFIVVHMLYRPFGETGFPTVVNGLQIVSIPAPASGLALLGLSAAIAARRRR